MIRIDLSELKQLDKGMKSYEKKAMTAIYAYGKSSATTIANKAKREARWTDRTGDARRSIKGSYLSYGTLGIIRLEGYAKNKYNREYFQYLEYAHKKKWSILRPTAEKELPRISKVIANRLSKIKIMTS